MPEPGGPADPSAKTCLVTGATGYIGGRLVPELLDRGYRVRVMTRSSRRLRDHPWVDRVEVVEADATDAGQVAAACAGVDVVYYLIHALAGGSGFEQADRRAAEAMAGAAREAGVARLVYLGGLAPEGEELSRHLRSRAEVADILLASDVPTVVLRAAVILGSGSVSFEMLRYLTERLPVMITPRWVQSRIQPIAIRDVLRYLVGCAELPADVHRGFDIGGPDVMSYEDMMQRFATVAGLPRRRIVPVPLFSPGLSSHWVGVITPVPAPLARNLVESLKNNVVCAEHDIDRYVPDPPEGLLGFEDAVRLALQRIKDRAVATRWSSASVPGVPSDPLPTDPGWAGGSLYVDERVRTTSASPEALWQVVEGIGGDAGWYSFPLAWEVRGWMDRLVGGVGLRRGRRDPADLQLGDALDWWRVEELDEGTLLRLRAEMRVPGLAWLEFHVEHDEEGTTTLRQRATFHPSGLLGQLYWWGVAPFHGVVFGGMLRNICRAAERGTAAERGSPRTAAAQTSNCAVASSR
jgi:uncharacterized protein YbjT (DUF2867 family)